MADYEIREYLPGDEHSLLACFNTVFGAQPGFQPRTLEQWNWAFGRNPAGFRIWLALHEGLVVAQYAALPYRVNLRGETRHFAQIVDSMVHPAHRAGLKRPGLFVQTALPFFAAYGDPHKDVVHYGWPIEEAWRIGKTFLDYEIVRTQTILGRAAGPGPTELPEGVERIERFDEQARWLYDRCSGPWGASTIRDDAFLNWRFVEHAWNRYEIYGVRDASGILRGYAVWRQADWVRPNMGVVVDWLVPPEEPEVGEKLHAALLARARAGGAQALAALFPEWSPWFARFQEQGWRVHPTHYFMVARNFIPRYDMLWLRDHWWYQLADTDLV
jgi:Acetyltransferase (GNAT) domain